MVLEVLDAAILQNEEDSIERALAILNSILYFKDGLNQQLLFYYPIICYLMIGKPNQQL